MTVSLSISFMSSIVGGGDYYANYQYYAQVKLFFKVSAAVVLYLLSLSEV
jgi:hypothetical protein